MAFRKPHFSGTDRRRSQGSYDPAAEDSRNLENAQGAGRSRSSEEVSGDMSDQAEHNFKNSSQINQITELFKKLDSEERKYCLYCLNVLENILSEQDVHLQNSRNTGTAEADDSNEKEINRFEILTDNGFAVIVRTNRPDEKTVRIPASIDGYRVKGIAKEVFSGLEALEEVYMEDGIGYLSDSVFSKCINLRKIRLPGTLKSIGNAAFQNTGIESIELPDSVERLGMFCFLDCKNLKSSVLSDGIITIPAYAFYGCTSLQKISLPRYLVNLEKSVFDKCGELSEVVLPEGTESLGAFSFSNCGQEFRIMIPDTVTYIARHAFGADFSNIHILCNPGSYASEYAEKFGIKAECPRVPAAANENSRRRRRGS